MLLTYSRSINIIIIKFSFRDVSRPTNIMYIIIIYHIAIILIHICNGDYINN